RVLNSILLATILVSPPGDIARWVSELGDPRYAVREQAAKQLWEAGPAAEPAVRAAAKSSDAQGARRARHIIEKYDWGIYSNTPPDVEAQIGRYRGGDDEAKQQAIKVLVHIGRPAYSAIGRFVARAGNHSERALLGELLSTATKEELPRLIRAR